MRISKLIKENVVALMTVLDAYRQRCEARPGYKQPLDAQIASRAKHSWSRY
jgi:hypothetical protein